MSAHFADAETETPPLRLRASDAPASGALLSLASGREPHPGLAPH